MYMQLEDEFGDVVGKARRGQELSPSQLASQAGLSEAEVKRIEEYELTPEDGVVEHLARTLGLDGEKLKASASKRYFPLYPGGRATDGIQVEMLVLGTDFLMNEYVVGCPQTKQGAIVDPGFEAEKILKAVETSGLEINMVLLTHGHGDHIGALSEVCQATGAPALVSSADAGLLGNLSTKIEGYITEGETVSLGTVVLNVAATPGHTQGGISLIHEQAAFVGDALFAGSLGGTRAKAHYDSQHGTVAEKILTLDDHVVLYPGHGPATTVAEERANNPFFA